jgi:hypothetical protein
VTISPALTCAPGVTGACAIDLEPTLDGTATVARPDEGNYDGGGWSFDADLLPAAGPTTWNGVPYLAPDPTGTAKNFRPATGQSMLLPAGEHSAVKMVATSYNGPVNGAFTIGYTDGTSEARAVSVPDWCNPLPGSVNLRSMPHRIKAGQGVDRPAVNLFGFTLPVAEGKTIRSISLPDDPRLTLYALTLT